ncbi:hypothetical protein Pint_04215 [Pistacia integerrima]|uniref:Uncharacterized protein n=1 Tax=Pistacia integerrima TaxID=434235 RepID=A0ACC0Z505_9ROSI|nr:hypothetical protein Pint_04215 [Pistacia integerrima]
MKITSWTTSRPNYKPWKSSFNSFWFLISFVDQGSLSSDDESAMELGSEELHDVNVEYDEDIMGSSPRSVVESPKDSVGSMSSADVTAEINRASDLLMAVSVSADTNKAKISDMAFSAMEELTKMALEGEPLWHRKGSSETETLNGLEYMKEFGSVDATLKEIMRMVEVGDPNAEQLPFEYVSHSSPILCEEFGQEHLHSEASRQIGLVTMNPISIVEFLMNVNQWSTALSNIISRAALLGVLSEGQGGRYNGTMQVMNMELHLPSALVPTRESYFVRYCKQLASGTWGVVDVSLENLFPYSTFKFRRRPSGCLIQDIPNGCSKVIWVEHVVVDNRLVHNIYRPLVTSGYAYSAKRWVAALIRHSEWLETLSAKTTTTNDGVLIPQAGRESVLKLGERMKRSFWGDISASNESTWMALPVCGSEDIRVMTRGVIQVLGESPTTKIAFTTSLWLPVPPKRVFDFLRDDSTRTQWDIRLCGRLIRELAYIINGDNPENRISILQVNATPEEIEMLYLQESFNDYTGFYVIYAPVDMVTMSRILNGGNSDCVNILPCGFAILPDTSPTLHIAEELNCGSLLSIAFHIIDRASANKYIPQESVNAIYKVITETVDLIKTALVPNNLQDTSMIW